MPIKCIIVEDNPSYLNIISSYIESADDIEIITTSTSEEDAVIKILHYEPDLIFLDINLGNGSGFNVLNKCEGAYKYVIFTTAFAEFAIKAFNYNSLHYLLKPYKKELVLNAIEKARQNLNETNISYSNLSKEKSEPLSVLFIPDKNKYFPIEINNIIYMSADGSYSEIHTLNDKIKVSKPLKSLLDSIENNTDILRVHKSYAVNKKYIKQIKRGINSSVLLDNDIELPISTQEKDNVFRLLRIKQ